MGNILVVEDQDAIRDLLLTYLRLDGHSADGEADAEAALSAFQANRYDVVVTDLMLPGHDGLWLLQQIRSLETDAKVILSTGYDGADVAVTALRQGAYDYVVKPVDSLAFKTKVREALRSLDAERRSRGAEDDALRRSQELTTLNVVGTLVHASLAPVESLGGALARILEVLRLPAGFVWLSGEGGVPESLVNSGVVDLRQGVLAASARAWLDDGDDRCSVEEWGSDGMEPALTWCLAPIATPETTFGVVACGLVGGPVPDALPGLLEAVGRQIAMALANGVTYSRERRRSELLRAAAESGREVVGAGTDVDHVVERALDGALRMLPAASAAIISVDEGGFDVLGTAGVDRSALVADLPARASLLNEWRFSWPAEPGTCLAIEDSGDLTKVGAVGLGGRSLAVARLRSDDQVIGFLVLSGAVQGAFGEADLEAGAVYGDLVATAVASARAFGRLERQGFEEQWALLDVSTRLLGVLDTEASCRAVLDVAIGSLRADHCTIYLPAATGELTVAATTFDVGTDVVGEPTRGASAAEYVARTARPAVTPDLAAETRFEPFPAAVAAGIQTELLVPMVHANEVAGVLALSWSQRRVVSARETRLASLLAHQAAIGAEQAKLYEAVIASRAALQTSNDTLRTAYDALARRASVIEGASRLASEAIQAGDSDQLHQRAAELALTTVNGDSSWVVSVGTGAPRTWTACRPGGKAPVGPIAEAVLERLRRSGRAKRWAPRGRSAATTAIPLIDGGQLLGAIGITAMPGRVFTDDDMKLLTSIGRQTLLAGRSIGLHRDLELAYDQTLTVLVSALARDRETEHHCERVRRVTLALAAEMEYREGTADWVELSRAAVLHDIGRMGVSDAILRKAGPLTELEWDEVRQHPEFGYDLLQPVQCLHGAAEILLCHHERWDGDGYPRRLKGDEIPLGARIFAVADAFDAMVSSRPYREALSADRAASEILRCRGSQFDPEVVDAFIRFFERLTPAEVAECGDPPNGRHIAA